MRDVVKGNRVWVEGLFLSVGSVHFPFSCHGLDVGGNLCAL